jgi:osmoprotectant transport system permease protein
LYSARKLTSNRRCFEAYSTPLTHCPQTLALRIPSLALAAALALCGAAGASAEALRVGSKRFTESYVLGEIVAQSARRAGAEAIHRPGMGNTAILLEALRNDAIDLYPEYSGTIAREILKVEGELTVAELDARLAPLGLGAAVALGFQNTYAIGVGRDVAARLGLAKISDLARHPGLRLGLSHEFLGRRDGWPGLSERYSLGSLSPAALDHGLAYEALAAGTVDGIDLYSTDAKIERLGIRVLEDDAGFFPRYDALLLHRRDAPARHPRAWAAIAALEGRIDAATMVRLNAAAEIDGRDFASVAGEFVSGAGGSRARRDLASALFGPDFGRLLAEHLALVLGSLAAAIAVGVPLGVAAARVRALAQPVLLAAGLVQTIPSLALLAILIPVTGTIGVWPALIALFLYALLPIVRNTHAGLLGVPEGLREAARALGLRPALSLRLVEIPLALPTILAGVKTAAVINVGTATIAAFIGAGGFGERIAQGLALNDHVVLLAGAIPAAALALAFHALFEVAERLLVRPPSPRRA